MRPDRTPPGSAADRTCERYLASIATGASQAEVVADLAETFGVKRQAIWRRLRAGGAIPPAQRVKRAASVDAMFARRAEKRVATVEILQQQVVDRDPCPFCGIRRDIGCRHVGVVG